MNVATPTETSAVNPDKKWQRSHFFVTASQKFCYCKIWVQTNETKLNEVLRGLIGKDNAEVVSETKSLSTKDDLLQAKAALKDNIRTLEEN
jgi:hypothetical protein